MLLNLPFESLYILFRLRQAGFQAYLVGGAVRDILLHDQKVKDFDFTTDAKPEEIEKLFAGSFYENDFGTVSITHEELMVLLKADQLIPPEENLLNKFLKEFENQEKQRQRIIDLKNASKIHVSLQEKAAGANQKINAKKGQVLAAFEITTFRSDGHYSDHRRPETVAWGENIADDLSRRDFTINALAIEVKDEYLKAIFQKELQSEYQLAENDFQLIDQHQGLADLEHGNIRTVGHPDERFSEDALRMLRAARFAVQLGMNIETNTYFSIKQNHELLRFVSWERIGDEVIKILASKDPARGIEILDKTGLLEEIMPELKLGKEMEQTGHHTSDVWDHSLDALRCCPSQDPIVRLATLLHDVGKPSTYKKETDNVTFYNHDVLGSRTASKIAKRLRLSKKNVERVFTLVRYHMFYYQPEHTDASIRRFIKRVGLENIDDILDVREGDRLGSGAKKTSWRLEEMKQRVIEQLNQPMDLTDLAINGNDLMSELNVKAGPILGKILNQLLELVLENPELNEKEALLAEAKKIIAQEN